MIAQVMVKNNKLDLEAMVMYSTIDHMDNKLKFAVKFKFNGADYRIDGHLDKFDVVASFTKGVSFGNDEVAKLFFEKLSGLIAIELCKDNQEQIINLLVGK